jgi:uncharacterized pyridoxal phosphate-containing UPF0001 family protein
MKTAVEWIAEQLIEGTMRPVEIIAIAKEMEKEQIMDAFEGGQMSFSTESLDYYNETFNK